MYESLLIGIKPDQDHSDLIDVATRAAKPGAKIHLVSLVRVGKEGDEPQRRQRAIDALDRLAATLNERGFEATSEVELIGVAAGHELVRIAEERVCDLIALGLGKRSRVGKALMGSDAQATITMAPCPVLTTHLGT